MEPFAMPESRQKTVLLLGSFYGDVLSSLVSSSGRHYTSRILHSGVSNWHKINRLFKDSTSVEVSHVIAKFTEFTLLHCADPSFDEERGRLFASVAGVPHLVF